MFDKRVAIAAGLTIVILAIVAWSGLLGFRSNESGVIVLQGNVDVRQVNLSFKVAGRIAEMMVDEGDKVETGKIVASLEKSYFADEVRLARAREAAQTAVVARLENGTRPEEVAQARAAVSEREAGVALAEATLNRQEDLAGRGVSPHQRHDEATAAAQQAQAALKSAQETLKLAEIGPRREDIDAAKGQLEAENAALAQAERRLTDADLIAPSHGVVLTRVREPGAIVATGETVYAVTVTSPVWVRSYVSEPDLGRIVPGMSVDVRTDGGKTYRGQIGFISPVAEFTPKSVETKELRTSLVYRLRVVVDGETAGLLQGMPVTVLVKTGNGS
ncbi:efflux RND transporter periplasmic adaptor subunit [Hyphomicrobium sp.]|uniref:efflux RND transporter periplasmic adaptor subunit n=1 Tax=Hyphomicrobium sp. TaxID=82 RepID=UPI0025C228F1|nr:efflux RND transporter periplasmic adaptor subunit [Hyphomicrobium sp.]